MIRLFVCSITILVEFVSICNVTAKNNSGFQAPLSITSFSPTSGFVGSKVVIKGTGFDSITVANNSVFLDNRLISVLSVSSNEITISIPPFAIGGYISITVNNQSATSESMFVVIPTITGFSQDSGSVNQTVVIYGTGFGLKVGSSVSDNTSTVFFGDVSAPVIQQTDTSITVMVPSGAWTSPVNVFNVGGTAVSLNKFKVLILIECIAPYSGKIGSEILLQASGLDLSNLANNTLSINGVEANVTGVNANGLTAIVPVGATSGPFVITSNGQKKQSPCNFTVLVDVTAMSPNQASVGSIITFTGTGFDPNPANNLVNFNGLTSQAVATTPTSLSVPVPLGATTGYITGISVDGVAYNFDPYNETSTFYLKIIPVVNSIYPTSGIAGDIIVIKGNGFDPNIVNDGVAFANEAYLSAKIIAATDSTLSFQVPNLATSGYLSVASGGLAALNSPLFTVLPVVQSFSPNTQLQGAKTVMTISGSGFISFGEYLTSDTVIFSPSIKVPVSTNSTTSLSVIIPFGISTGPIQVKVANHLVTTVADLIVLKDSIPPTISVNSPKNIVEGSSNNDIQVTITDNALVNMATIYYRGIAGIRWNSFPLTAGLQSFSAQIPIQNSWYDKMGLEFYFTATDPSGNSTRSPNEEGSYYTTTLINTSVSIPNIPFGDKTTDYRIISFPYVIDSNSAVNQVSLILKNIVGNPRSGQFFEYSPKNKESNAAGYLSYGANQFSAIQPGGGYWILTRNPEISNRILNISSPLYTKKKLFKLALLPGWNLIGNPYPVQVSWSDVLTLNNNQNIHSLNVYKGGWAVSDSLSSFQGGFVYNSDVVIDTILIPFMGQTQIGGRSLNMSLGTDLTRDSWNLFIHASQGNSYNNLGGFGMHLLANSGSDPFDNFNPPGLENSIEVDFIELEFPGLSFSNDIVKTSTRHVWQFNFVGNVGEPAELTWNNEITLETQKLALYDEGNMRVIFMNEKNQYQFTPRGNDRFSIYFADDISIMPNLMNVSLPYPNPLQTERITNIELALPYGSQNYSYTYQLFNYNGLEVSSRHNSLDPGLQKLILAFDQSLGSGLYYYRLTINSADSSHSYTGKIILP